MLVLAMDCSRAMDLRYYYTDQISGGHSGRVTPVPIPNTEVKPASADGTWGEAPWESRASPDLFYPVLSLTERGFYLSLCVSVPFS